MIANEKTPENSVTIQSRWVDGKTFVGIANGATTAGRSQAVEMYAGALNALQIVIEDQQRTTFPEWQDGKRFADQVAERAIKMRPARRVERRGM